MTEITGEQQSDSGIASNETLTSSLGENFAGEIKSELHTERHLDMMVGEVLNMRHEQGKPDLISLIRDRAVASKREGSFNKEIEESDLDLTDQEYIVMTVVEYLLGDKATSATGLSRKEKQPLLVYRHKQLRN